MTRSKAPRILDSPPLRRFEVEYLDPRAGKGRCYVIAASAREARAIAAIRHPGAELGEPVAWSDQP